MLGTKRTEQAPWSCDSWRRMRGEWEVGLAGIVLMMGAAQTTEAERCELSWSILGLDGSSAVGPQQNQPLVMCVSVCVTREKNRN